tara:strand:+ start:234 stop:632 length:399 start_codon:yes stop_codon:yes gene_type:complete
MITSNVSYDVRDRVLINLKVIAQIPPQGRISLRGGVISIEPVSYMAWFKRWMKGDNREGMARYIRDITSCVIQLVTNDVNHEDTELSASIHASLTGLTNIQQTYESDAYVVAQIDIVMNKLRGCMSVYQQVN